MISFNVAGSIYFASVISFFSGRKLRIWENTGTIYVLKFSITSLWTLNHRIILTKKIYSKQRHLIIQGPFGNMLYLKKWKANTCCYRSVLRQQIVVTRTIQRQCFFFIEISFISSISFLLMIIFISETCIPKSVWKESTNPYRFL